MPNRRPPREYPEVNSADVMDHAVALFCEALPRLKEQACHWMSVTEAAHELDLTRRYVARLFEERRLAGYVNADGEICICAHHVAQERDRRRLRRTRWRPKR